MGYCTGEYTMSASLTASETDLTDVGGIGTKTAENLLEQFESEDVVFDAVQSVPAWVQDHIDGIGASNLSNLRSYASDRGHSDQTDRSLSALRGTKFKGRYDNRYYACGQREDNICLFYTGYFQGKSYTTTFSGRQSFTRDRVNRLAWTFFSFSEREHIVLEYERRGKKQYVAEVIDANEWKTLTDTGAVYYQKGRNYEPDHYPETTDGWSQKSSSTGSGQELRSLELIGITADRVALYRFGDGNKIFRFVKEPGVDGNVLRRLYGYTHFGTDRDYELGEFGTIESFVKKLSDNDEWKTYAGNAYVTEGYQQYL